MNNQIIIGLILGSITIIFLLWTIIKKYKRKGHYYLYKGNYYRIVGQVQVKNYFGEWEEGILYKSHTGRLYVREREDFYKRFVEIWEI